jgi:hypothetical protein
MIDVGLPEAVANDNALAVAWVADGDRDYLTDDAPQILGRTAGSFEQFATHYAQAFSRVSQMVLVRRRRTRQLAKPPPFEALDRSRAQRKKGNDDDQQH